MRSDRTDKQSRIFTTHVNAVRALAQTVSVDSLHNFTIQMCDGKRTPQSQIQQTRIAPAYTQTDDDRLLTGNAKNTIYGTTRWLGSHMLFDGIAKDLNGRQTYGIVHGMFQMVFNRAREKIVFGQQQEPCDPHLANLRFT